MKRLPQIIKVLAFAVVGCIVGAFFLMFGPRLGFDPVRLVLDSIKLTDNSTVFLVQQTNGRGLGQHTVELVRVLPDNSATSTLLAFKDPYWWFGKLRMSDDGKFLEARACGDVGARLELASGLIFKDGSTNAIPDGQIRRCRADESALLLAAQSN